MFVVLASLALASDPTLEDSRLATETEAEIIVEVASSEDLMEYSLLEGSEEVAWGQAAVDPEGRVHLGHDLGSAEDLRLLLTPIDDEGFADAVTSLHVFARK